LLSWFNPFKEKKEWLFHLKVLSINIEGYLKKCKEILQKYNALLIADEIQTGLGRTGKLLCSDYDNVRPDIVLLGKALSGGFYPVSAVLCDDEIMGLIKPGEHGSTYGGNPLASTTAITALDVLLEEKMCENANKMGKIFKKALSEIIDKDKIKEIRGKGLFVGVQFNSDKFAYNFSNALLRNGIIAKPTQKHTIRFAPPLVIT
jgi:ornithine--oxo-acid transaminase